MQKTTEESSVYDEKQVLVKKEKGFEMVAALVFGASICLRKLQNQFAEYFSPISQMPEIKVKNENKNKKILN